MFQALLVLSLLAGCSFFKGKGNERAEGHHRLYSAPEAEEGTELPDHQKRVVIVATNDWRGRLEARQQGAKDKHHPEEILVSVGGVEVFARHLDILRRAHPGAVLLVDAGDGFSQDKQKPVPARAMLEARQELGYDALALSAADLNTLAAPLSSSVPALLKKTPAPALFGNVVDLHTTSPVDWGKNSPAITRTLNGVTVGVVSLLHDGATTIIPPAKLNGLYVEPALQALLKHSRALRLKGAKIVVALMHGGIDCGKARAEKQGLPVDKVNFEPRDAGACDLSTGIGPFLAALPPGIADVVVTGGGEGKAANFVNGMVVLQTPGGPAAFSRVDLVYDSKKDELVPEQTDIHQPVRLCHRFFKATEDCYTSDPSVDHRELVPARYLGEDVLPVPAATTWMESWRERAWAEPAEDEVTLVEAASDRGPDLPSTQP